MLAKVTLLSASFTHSVSLCALVSRDRKSERDAKVQDFYLCTMILLTGIHSVGSSSSLVFLLPVSRFPFLCDLDVGPDQEGKDQRNKNEEM